jgi:hypothetical protein
VSHAQRQAPDPNSAIGYITPKDMLAGHQQQEILR